MASLIREHEQIRMADMTVRGGIGGTKEVERFRQEWRSRALENTTGPETREDVEKWADDLWLQYNRARNRPVS